MERAAYFGDVILVLQDVDVLKQRLLLLPQLLGLGLLLRSKSKPKKDVKIVAWPMIVLLVLLLAGSILMIVGMYS